MVVTNCGSIIAAFTVVLDRDVQLSGHDLMITDDPR